MIILLRWILRNGTDKSKGVKKSKACENVKSNKVIKYFQLCIYWNTMY